MKNHFFNTIPEPYRKLIRNKYFITFFSFLIWMSFFDRNDFITQHTYRHKLHELQKERDYYMKEVVTNKAEVNDLLTNPKSLEKLAREKYRMKRDNEDVFVIVQEPAKEK
ncbi:MAG: septum formation initiator family protein [Bacteroidetes bacterium]|nr:septum formation initiator family protein [Bacteroidota bacterium]